MKKDPQNTGCHAVKKSADTLEHIGRCRPDIVIIDISNIGMSGIDLIKSIRREFENIPLLVLSMYEGSFITSNLLGAVADSCLVPIKAVDGIYEKIHSLVEE